MNMDALLILCLCGMAHVAVVEGIEDSPVKKTRGWDYYNDSDLKSPDKAKGVPNYKWRKGWDYFRDSHFKSPGNANAKGLSNEKRRRGWDYYEDSDLKSPDNAKGFSNEKGRRGWDYYEDLDLKSPGNAKGLSNEKGRRGWDYYEDSDFKSPDNAKGLSNDNKRGWDYDGQEKSLEEAVQSFEPAFKDIFLSNWELDQNDEIDLRIDFNRKSLKGSLYFTHAVFTIPPLLEIDGWPTYKSKRDAVEITYKYIIERALFHTLYEVEVESGTMRGIYDATFTGLDMKTQLTATRDRFGECTYKARVNISSVPHSSKSQSLIRTGLKDKKLTKKVEVIVNTYVVDRFLKQNEIAVVHKYNSHFEQAIDNEVSKKFRQEFDKQLCDYA